MPTNLPLSDKSRDAIRFALALQVPLGLFFTLLLDGGHLAKIGGYAMIGFWTGVALILLRRPLSPTRDDLLFIRAGYLPLLFIAALSAGLFRG